MANLKTVILRVEDRTFTLEVDITEEGLITDMLSSLERALEEGTPLRVVRHAAQSLSMSQSIISRVLWKAKDLDDWIADVRGLLRLQKRKL
jgi:hypothetical protein